MIQYKFDVVVVGAGPAGVAAAGSLARAGISVALLEAGVYAGAENWSGCVYFTENLAAEDCFGNESVEAAPFERRVTRRGTLLHNGLDVLGLEVRDSTLFKNCYTVLRPVYDPYFAHLARLKGAVHLTATTVTALIRKNGRVIGVETNRGPLYADMVFLAEGDASHLVRSEQLERTARPHYMQGVKAVLSLPSQEIETRFGLASGEGAAYELLVRNASIAGRTARLNVGGFLYTNRDSLSLGYVLPLANLRNNYHGDHDRLFEWLRGLPLLREFTHDAKLTAYGTKIIRSGGWNERPVLVQDGLAVGGASTGLGIDIPFPNFTGPASASGLYFARAAIALLRDGKAPDSRNLSRAYLEPLRESVYGKNARYLSRWPAYFGKSSTLFGRTIDIVCGTSHFIASGSLLNTGRFLRSHLLSFRGLRDSISDTLRAVTSLRLWKPIALSALNPATIGQWIANLAKKPALPDPELVITLKITGQDVDGRKLPWPAGSLIRRLSPALLQALKTVYANNDRPMMGKAAEAVHFLIRGLRLTDLVILPAFSIVLLFLSAWSALWDAFRYYVLKTPVATILAEPVMAYNELLRKARDLDAIKPELSLEAKLATNTYRTGSASHIRTIWPEAISDHTEMSKAGLWWVCPARVYGYDAPLFGRGKVTVNFENCIKCESCWRAEPDRVFWGRHTDHKLIYRPETAAIIDLLKARREPVLVGQGSGKSPVPMTRELWYLDEDSRRAGKAVQQALAAFRDAIQHLPASADKGRLGWPLLLGKRLAERLRRFETILADSRWHDLADTIRTERTDIELKLTEKRLFHALYACNRLEQRLAVLDEEKDGAVSSATSRTAQRKTVEHASNDAAAVFPDRTVKQWEEDSMPEPWAETLRTFIASHQSDPIGTVRSLALVNPALGLVAAHHFCAINILSQAGRKLGEGISAVRADHLDIEEADTVRIRGVLPLIPCAATRMLLLLNRRRGYLVPLGSPGVTVTPSPSIGFRAAGLSEVALDCTIKKDAVSIREGEPAPAPASYLAIALGTTDYLSGRIKEHATGRVQFPGQMLDTEGRDGIAKLGAVKALIARTEAWRLLLQALYDSYSAIRDERAALELDLLSSTVAALAFSPDPGTIGYDAGQVFGGFAYSEDDLLSRFYRDSALFRFLPPGLDASVRLHRLLSSRKAGETPRLHTVVTGEPLSNDSQRLAELHGACLNLPPGIDSALAGEAQALALGLRLFLSAIEEGLNSGRSMEMESAALAVLLKQLEQRLASARLSAARGRVLPTAFFPIEPAEKAVVLDMDYELFCGAPGAPHASGSFLSTAFDRSPRFTPEMQLHDPRLRARWTELVDWFKGHCKGRKFDGLDIERAIEKIHRLPDFVIDAVKKHKWLATYIPKSEDGLGWHKAEYYLLNSAAGSFGDAGINLLIMASTSIGTTPILLGLEEELPRVREELAPLAEDEKKLGEIGARLGKITGTLSNPNPSWIKKEYEAVMQLVEKRIRRTRVVKYLAANFLRAFYGAGIAGRRGDFGNFTSNLRHAGDLFTRLMPDVRAALDELPRRERCHRLFLRSLGHGGVSAFALTEPTAGSDSGGVKTTAKLHSTKLTALSDGRYAFRLNDQDETSTRYLIDADRVVFQDRGAAYRTPDGQTASIRYDKYDYTTDQGVRYYELEGKSCEFHDIGQIRKTDDGMAYEYYALTGAKMWITNGSIATQFCLYAQTAEGVTGFLVDRHSEGLKVGADEKKMGQRGSPTNEISIDSVRVPREAVIGYEGHGQVNALETLNVGRCGLAVVSGALMRKLMHEAVAAVPAKPERDALLGEAAAIMFGSESLAHYLIGLFDRPHESVRMESAIAKYVCSEDIHELLTLVERAFGPAGLTEKFLLEKARRDSRILTIYEGTNEVQRFLILKDLIALAPKWPELALPENDKTGRILGEWKNRLRTHARSAADLLGDSAWSDAMLQPALFPLAEMAGEILRLECIYYRKEWLEARTALLGESYTRPLLAAGTRAAERALSRLAFLDASYASAQDLIRNGLDMPEVVVADAALDAKETGSSAPAPQGVLKVPVRILAVIRPVADLPPRPRLLDGTIQELVWRINTRDLAGLTQALDLKTAGNAPVQVDVLMPGGPEHDDLLKMAGQARADRLHRINLDPAAAPRELIAAIQSCEAGQPFDIIITGAESSDGERGLGTFLAGALKCSHYYQDRLEVGPNGTGFGSIKPPAVISISASAAELETTMVRTVDAFYSSIRVLDSSQQRKALPVKFSLPAALEVKKTAITGVRQAADYLRSCAATTKASAVPDHVDDIPRGALDGTNAVWAILDPREPKSNLAVLRAAHLAAGLVSQEVHVAIPAPRNMFPQLVGFARAHGARRAFCLDTNDGSLSNDGQRELLRAIVKDAGTLIIAGKEWQGSFSYTAGELHSPEVRALVCSGVTALERGSEGLLTFSLPAYEGMLVRHCMWQGGSALVTVAAEADFPAAGRSSEFSAVIADLPLSPGWVRPLRQIAAPSLSQAEVIIDLGYGIRDRAGLGLAEELKRTLESMGLEPMFGATRKVTQDLKLLPLEAQIGQTGVRVNPKVIIALGISGAPQHVDYIASRAEILCFNKDADAPLMMLNEVRSVPRVHPIAGDLFVTVRELIAELKR